MSLLMVLVWYPIIGGFSILCEKENLFVHRHNGVFYLYGDDPIVEYHKYLFDFLDILPIQIRFLLCYYIYNFTFNAAVDYMTFGARGERYGN